MNILQSIIIAITSGAVVSIFNYLLTKDQEQRQSKMKSYSALLDNARAFLDDPNLSKKKGERLKKHSYKNTMMKLFLLPTLILKRKLKTLSKQVEFLQQTQAFKFES
jgi:hypothetical protein